MSAVNFRRFSNPGTLRSIKPEYLFRFLSPYTAFFTSRGLELPPPGNGQTPDYDSLTAIFLNPDQDTPRQLIDALYFVHEMATDEGMQSLLEEARIRVLPIDDDHDLAPIDVAIQVWLLDEDILQEKHAEQFLSRPRSFEHFQTENRNLPDFHIPEATALRALEADLDGWYVEHKRGLGSRVFVYPRVDGIWFLIRHGDAFRREGSLDNGEPGSVAFRPLKYDVLVYDQSIGEIRMNAGTVGEKNLYRQKFGLHLFGDEEYFPGTAKYTLEPLRDDGDASLVCSDIEGIEWIRLKEVQFYWGGAHGEIEIRKARDVFAAYADRDRSFPRRARIIKATFDMKFEDCKTTRSMTIKPSNIAQYTRDHDSVFVEKWLSKRGFIIQRETPSDVDAEPVLAGD